MTAKTPVFYTIMSLLVTVAGCEIESEQDTRTVAEPHDVTEATIPELQAAMSEGRLTARDLVQQYLTRIALYENLLNATIAVNPNALAEAERLDRERAATGARGPLHGIPIALKDNIHTTDMPTTGGALAFEGFVPPYDATVTEQLRDAGAIIIAKTVMTELANWVAGAPYRMPGNYSSLGEYGFNPYDPRRDPRPEIGDGLPVLSAGGSSSGIGTSAPLRSLTELREWNRENELLGTLKYEQSLLDISDEVDLDLDRPRYEADRAKDIELNGAQGIDAAIAGNDLDALLFPMTRGADVSARPGYPTVIVPMGLVPVETEPAFPEDFEPQPAPFGVSFAGLPCSEPRLIALAYAFEQATLRRVPPPSTP